MRCKYLNNDSCTIASQLASNTVSPTVLQCEYCSNKAEPNQAINKVTVSLAIGHSTPEIKSQLLKDYSILLTTTTTINTIGPGTELKKLISWFYSPNKRKCNCLNRINKMNKWGPDECEKRQATILRWLRHSAKLAKVPYFDTIGKLLLWKAIKRSRLQLRQHQEKTAPSNIVLHQLKPVDGVQ